MKENDGWMDVRFKAHEKGISKTSVVFYDAARHGVFVCVQLHADVRCGDFV